MTKGGRITSGFQTGRGTFQNRTLGMLRKAASCRETHTCTGEPRRVQHYGTPAPITLATLPSMRKPDPDDGPTDGA